MLQLQYEKARVSITRAEAFSVTSDLGTEASIAEFLTKHWHDVLPLWQKHSLDLEKEEEGPIILEKEAEPVLPNAATVAGLLHIVHNLLLEVDNALEGWKDFIKQLKAVASLFQTLHTRQRFKHTLLKGSRFEGSPLAKLLDTDLETPAEWRWQSLRKAIEKLLKLEPLIVALWNATKYVKGDAESGPDLEQATQQKQKAELDLAAITQAVRYSHKK